MLSKASNILEITPMQGTAKFLFQDMIQRARMQLTDKSYTVIPDCSEKTLQAIVDALKSDLDEFKKIIQFIEIYI